MGPWILKKLYSCTIESILTGCITAWYGKCTALDRKALQRVVRTARYITGAELPAIQDIQDIYIRQCQRKARKIAKDSSHCLANRTGSVKNIFEGELGVVDFHPFNKRCILFVFETDNVANSSLQDIVVVENTRLSEQYFPAMQKFVVCKLGLKLLPAASQLEASQLHTRIVHGASKDNLFRRRSVSRLLDPLVMSLVQQIPGVGKVKAMALLQHYSIIHQLCNTGTHELEPIVGHALAQHIRNFFHNPLV